MMTPPKHRGTIARQLRRLFPPPVCGYLDTVCNAPFIRIMCEEHHKGIDWRMVEAHSLDSSGRLLMPADIECPPDTDLRRFTPIRFIRRMMENLTIESLVMCSVPPAERSIAVYGNEAEIIQLIPRLVPLVGEIRIITRRGYAVTDIVEQTIRETGMSIIVSDEPDVGDSRLLLAPFGGAGYIKTRPETVIIAPDHPCTDNAAWVSSVRITVPSSLEIAYDKQYDPLEFTGAFYELAGIRSLARLSPECGCCGEKEITSAQLAELIV